jgi:predicted nucleic acid-binding protein
LAGELAICAVTALELGFSARSGDDHLLVAAIAEQGNFVVLHYDGTSIASPR